MNPEFFEFQYGLNHSYYCPQVGGCAAQTGVAQQNAKQPLTSMQTNHTPSRGLFTAPCPKCGDALPLPRLGWLNKSKVAQTNHTPAPL